jgi:transposase
MAEKNGRPFRVPTDEEINLISYWVGENLSLPNAARHAEHDPATVYRWMEQGREDNSKELDTPYTKLFKSVSKSQSEKITKLLNKIEECPKNFNALCWILEKCFREEFSNDAEEYKYLVEKFLKLQDAYDRLKKKQSLQGVAKDG